MSILLVMFAAAACLLRNRRREIVVDRFVQRGPGTLERRGDLKYAVNRRRVTATRAALADGDTVVVTRMVKPARATTALRVASVAVLGLALLSLCLHARPRPRRQPRGRGPAEPSVPQ